MCLYLLKGAALCPNQLLLLALRHLEVGRLLQPEVQLQDAGISGPIVKRAVSSDALTHASFTQSCLRMRCSHIPDGKVICCRLAHVVTTAFCVERTAAGKSGHEGCAPPGQQPHHPPMQPASSGWASGWTTGPYMWAKVAPARC